MPARVEAQDGKVAEAHVSGLVDKQQDLRFDGCASEVVFVNLADEIVDQSAEHTAGSVVVDERCDDVEGVGSGAEPFEVDVA